MKAMSAGRVLLRAFLFCCVNRERRHCGVVVKGNSSVTSPQGLNPRPTTRCVTLGNLFNHSLLQCSYPLYADNSSTYHIGLLNA